VTIMQARRHISTFAIAALAALCVSLSIPTAFAVAPLPDVVDSLKAQGRWEWYLRVQADARNRGFDAPVERATESITRMAAGATVFDHRIPCILVDFSDNPASGGKIASTPAMFDSLLFSTGKKNPTGSLKEYYSEVSYGQMNVIGTVVGWFRMPQTYAYYVDHEMGMGTVPPNAASLAVAAIDSAAQYLDFSQFDNNRDGFVDGVMIVFPGPGYEETGDSNMIQSHKYVASISKQYNGVWVLNYTIQPEETNRQGGGLNSMGVFCHEWGHILGLPDLYDLDNTPGTESWGLGAWSLMATGNYNGPVGELGRSPAHLDAWSRIRLGFATPTVPNTNLTGVSIPQIETTPTIYKLWTGGGISGQYFLVENREKTGFDSYLPGQGLLIYHIDPLMTSNRNQWIEGVNPYNTAHYMVALEQADSYYNLEHYTPNQGDGGDPHYSDSAGFDDLSRPSSRSYQGQSSQVAVWNISAPGATMTANLDVVFSRPYLRTSNHAISDPAGNNNGIPEPGETFRIIFDLADLWQATNNVDVTVRAPGSGLIPVDSTFHAATLGSGVTINNSTDPILFSVPSVYRSRSVTFELMITAAGGVSRWVNTASFEIGRPHELIVDDDRGGIREGRLQDALTALGEVHRTWNVSTRGTPPADTLLAYPTVIWMTGDSNSISPTHASVLAMKSFLDNHGHLFVTGQDIAENLATGPDSSFLFDYFGVGYGGSEPYPQIVAVVAGVPGDPISNGLNLNGQASDGAINQKSHDILTPRPGAQAVVCYNYLFDPEYKAAAIHIERNSYRAVFFAFGFEAITSLQYQGTFPFNTRPQALAPVLNWLDGDIPTGVFDDPGSEVAVAGVPERFELSQNYPNPFNAGTTIPFTLTGSHPREVRLEVFDILGRQVRVLLNETLPAGRQQVNWDGTDRRGDAVASGVYFYRLTVSGEGVAARRMVVLK